MTIWRWVGLAGVTLCVLLFLPLRGCLFGRPASVQEIIFRGPGKRWVRAGALDSRFDADRVALDIWSQHGPLRREIAATDEGGLMVWAAWSEDGTRLYVLSCGIGTPETIETIDAERSNTGTVKEAEQRLALAMRGHFGQDPYLKKSSDSGSAVAWFCNGFGRNALRDEVTRAGGVLEIRHFTNVR